MLRKTRVLSLCVAVVLCALFARATHAADGTYVNAAGSFWSTPGNWAGGIVADGIDFNALFSSDITGTHTTLAIDSDRTIGNLLLNDNGAAGAPWVLGSYLGGTLNLDVSAGSPVVNAVTNVTFNVVVTGNDGLTKSGGGTLVLSSANTYTGVTHVTGGTLVAGATNTLPGSTAVLLDNTAGVTLGLVHQNQAIGSLAGGGTTGGNVSLGSAVLTTGADNSSTTYSGVISGNGGLTKTGAGVFTLTNANTYTGLTTINDGTLALVSVAPTNHLADSGKVVVGVNGAAATLDISGANTGETIGSLSGSSGGIVTLGNHTLTVGAANLFKPSTTFAGVIQGSGGLTKLGVGALTLTGNNTSTGTTTIGAGSTIALGVSNALSDSTIVSNSGTLRVVAGVSDTIAGFGPSMNSTILLEAGSNLSFTSGATIFGASGLLTGSGRLAYANASQSVTFNNTAPTFTGTLELNLGLDAQANLNAAVRTFSFADVVINNIGAAGSAQIDQGTTSTFLGSLSGNGAIRFGGNGSTAVGFNNHSTTFTGTLGQTFTNNSFVKVGSGMMVMAGAGAGSQSLGTFVHGGTLVLAREGADRGITNGGASVVIGDSLGVDILAIAANDQINNSAPITINPTGMLQLTSGATDAVGSIAGPAGAQIDLGAFGGDTTALAFGGNNTATTYAGSISGTNAGIRKNGTGVTTLSGASSYTGSTTVAAGTLKVTHSAALGSAAGATNVLAGATLEIASTNNTGPLSIGDSFNIAGTGVSSAGAINNSLGANAITGGVALTASATINVSDAFGSLTVAGPVTGAVGSNLTKAGAGALVLSDSGNYDGHTLINAGTLIAAGSGALGSTTGSTSIASGASLGLQNNIALGDAIGAASGASIRNRSGANTLNNTIAFTGTTTITADPGSTLTLAGPTAIVGSGSGTQQLIINTPGNGMVAISGTVALVSTNTSNSNAFPPVFQKVRTGTVLLTAPLFMSTTQSAAPPFFDFLVSVDGGEMRLAGPAGSINLAGTGTQAIRVSAGGTLVLDNSVDNATNRVTDGKQIWFNGGTLRFIGMDNAVSSETFGALLLEDDSGDSVLEVSNGSGAATSALTFSSFITPGANSGRAMTFKATTGALSTAGANQIIFTAAPALTNGILYGGGFVSDSLGLNFATLDSNRVVAFNGYSAFDANADTQGSLNTLITGDVTQTVNKSVNALKILPAASGGLTISGGGDLVVSSGGIILDGSNGGSDYLISHDTAGTELQAGASGTLFLEVEQANLTISAPLANVGRLAKGGEGTVTLTGSNGAMVGEVHVNKGLLVASNNTALGDTGAATIVHNGATLEINSLNYSNPEPLTLLGIGINNAGAFRATGVSAWAGPVTLGGIDPTIGTPSSGDALTLNGILGGASDLHKVGSGTVIIANASNNFTGGVFIDEGSILVTTNGGLGATTGTTAVASGAALRLVNVTYSAAEPLAISGSGPGGFGALYGTGISSFAGTVTLVSDAAIGVGVIATDVLTLTAPINGAGGLTKAANGSLVLAGASTYQGATNLNDGGTQLAGGNDRLPTATNLTVAAPASLDINGFNQTVGALAGAGLITNTSITSATFTSNSVSDSNFGGSLTGAALAFTKSGPGVLTLSGTNTYGGVTTINPGTPGSLRVTGGSAIPDASTVSLSGPGALFDVQQSETIGNLAGAGGVVNIPVGSTLTFGAGTNATYSGALTGSGSLVKAGTGSATFNGPDSGAYTGGVTVNAGVLIPSGSTYLPGGIVSSPLARSQVALAGTGTLLVPSTNDTVRIGSLSGTGAVVGQGAFPSLAMGSDNSSTTFAGAFFGPISGFTGQLGIIKEGTGTFVNEGANPPTVGTTTSHSNGSWTVNGGVVIARNTMSGTGVAGNTGRTVNGSSLVIGNGVDAATFRIEVERQLAGHPTSPGGTTVNIKNQGRLEIADGVFEGFSTLTGDSGAVVATGAGSGIWLETPAVNSVWAGAIQGGANITLISFNSSQWIWSGANTYTGATTVGGNTGGNQGTLVMAADNVLPSSTRLTLGVDSRGSGVLNMNGFDQSVGSIEEGSQAPGSNSILTGDVPGNGILTVGSNNLTTTFRGPITGAGGINKVGLGTLQLGSAANTAAQYTGATSVSGGGRLNMLTTAGAEALADFSMVSVSGAGSILDITAISAVGERIGGLAGTGTGTFALGAKNLIVGSSNNLSGTYAGAITGSGLITKEGQGTLLLTGVTSTYTGATVVDAGTLGISNDAALGNTPSTTINAATLRAAGTFATSRNIVLGHAASSIEVDAAQQFTVNSAFAGSQPDRGLTKTGAGVLELNANNTYPGITRVHQGTLLVNGTTTGQGNYSVDSGATLGGSGVIGLTPGASLTAHSGATVAPGLSPGILTLNGNLNLESGSFFNVELNGITAGVGGYDRLDVNGSVSLNDSILSPSLGFAPSANDRFFILTNDDLDAVAGTFAGLDDNDVIPLSFNSVTYNFRINYTGDLGSNSDTGGNDIVLTNIVAAALPALTTTPADGDTLSFGNVRVGNSAAASVTATNSGDPGTTLTGRFGGTSGVPFSPTTDSSPDFALAQGASDARSYTFAPTARGAAADAITLATDGGNSSINLAGTGVGPVYTSDPAPGSTIDFGNVRVTTPGTAANLTLSITNTSSDGDLGNDTLLTVHNSTTYTGGDAADFGVTGAGATVQVGDPALELGLSFTPTTRGAKSSTLVVDTDENAPLGGDGSSFNYAVGGQGVGPVYTSDPSPGTTINFGNVRVTTPGTTANQTLSITNTSSDGDLGNATLLTVHGSTGYAGGDAAQFGVTGAGAAVQVGDPALALGLSFTPTSRGAKSSTLVVNTDQNAALGGDGSDFNYPVLGQGVGPVYASSPVAPNGVIDFNTVTLGDFSDFILTISNTSTDPVGPDSRLTLNTIVISGLDHSQFSLPGFVDGTFIEAGGDFPLTIRFTPTGLAGARSASLSVQTDQNAALGGNGDDFLYSLTGFAQDAATPVAALSTSPADGDTLSFGNVRVGTASTSTVSATNTGETGSTLTGRFGGASGAGFAPTTDSSPDFALADGQTDTRDYSFAPAGRGAAGGDFTVSTNAGDSTILLSGNGVGPVFDSDIAPGSTINFGAVNPGGSFEVMLTVSNITTDGDLLELTDLSLDATFTGSTAFSLVSFAPDVLSAGESLILTIRFEPTGGFGNKFATLTLLTDQGAPFGGNGDDFQYFLTGALRNPNPGPVGEVPEPATAALIAAGVLALTRRRR